MDGARLASELAERLSQVLPDGFSISSDGNCLWLDTPDGFGNSAWAGAVDEDPTNWSLYPGAAWVVLSSIQDGVSLTLRECWPLVMVGGEHQMAAPGARVVDDRLELWYGSEDAPAIRLTPIRLTDSLGCRRADKNREDARARVLRTAGGLTPFLRLVRVSLRRQDRLCRATCRGANGMTSRERVVRITSAVVPITLVLAGVSCTSPTEPTSAPPLAPGAYMLSILAPDAVFFDGQVVAACPGAGLGNYGYIMASAAVENDGSSSRVRPATPAAGDFEMRLEAGSTGTSVSGSIRGVVVNTAFPPGGTPADARAMFAGLAMGIDNPIDGEVMGDSVIADGTVGGQVAVGNAGGSAVNCVPGTVRWSLNSLR